MALPTVTVTTLLISAVPVNTGVVSLVSVVVSVGATGARLSYVTLPEPGVVLPATSVVLSVTTCEPCVSRKVPLVGVAVAVSRFHTPLPSARVEKLAPPTVTSTVMLTPAVPLSIGVATFVVSAFTVGATGATLSSVTLPVPSDALPAASWLDRLTALAPSAPRLRLPRTGVALRTLTDQTPELLATTL